MSENREHRETEHPIELADLSANVSSKGRDERSWRSGGTPKDTISKGTSMPISHSILPRFSSSSSSYMLDEAGKQLSQRLLNLTIATGSVPDDLRSTTPVPKPQRSSMTELSPATLSRLRACGSTNSVTNSPSITEVTELADLTDLAANSTMHSESSGLRLPMFGSASSNRESPSTSQVSVGSIPPTLTAALLPSMRHHYDLTPIMRNTSSSGDQYIDVGNRYDESNRPMAVTPSDEKDHDPDDGLFLHGEHLAMPSDLTAADPSMPQLQPSTARPSEARNTAYILPGLSHNFHPTDVPDNLPPPVDFPSRKFYTFTSRRQYEEDMAIRDQSVVRFPHAIKPYQPNRHENFDIERLPQEELDRIFIARSVPRTVLVNSATSFPHPETGSNGTTDDSDTHENHRMLRATIPLDEGRHWSIPSLRMAHQLHGSTTSLTETTDLEDEDSLVYINTNNHLHLYPTSSAPDFTHGFPDNGIVEIHGIDDNFSVSSRGSSQCPNDEITAMSHLRPYISPPHHPVGVLSEMYSDDTDSVEAVAMGGESIPTSTALYHSESSRRRKRKQDRQKEAYEWLQSVEVDQNVLAEAASSKFLTSGNCYEENSFPQQFLHHQLLRPDQKMDGVAHYNQENLNLHPLSASSIFQRQISSPPNLMKREL